MAANPGLAFGPVTKIIATQWNAMSDPEKAPYLERTNELKAAQEQAKAAFKAELDACVTSTQ
jgi:hypothetical protein